MTTYTLTTPPATEPVELAKVRRHLRVFVEDDDEDAYLMALVGAARELTEAACVRSWCSQVWTATFDAFPDGDKPIKLLYGPVTAIDSIAYGADDAELDSGAYTLAGDLVKPVDEWPDSDGPVKVTFHAGAEDADDVPQSARLAMLMLVGSWYENRMSVSSTPMSEVPFAVRSLLGSLWRGVYP
jgi:uncharacterized phiE125 gp8 family phage protein